MNIRRIATQVALTEKPVTIFYGAEVSGAEYDPGYIESLPIVSLPLNLVDPHEPINKTNSPEGRETVAIYSDLIRQGKDVDPVLVRRVWFGDAVRFNIIDGHHRYVAYQNEGKDMISASVVPEDDILEVWQ
jgi:ParB-like chromosome segregation protein Spo0J